MFRSPFFLTIILTALSAAYADDTFQLETGVPSQGTYSVTVGVSVTNNTGRFIKNLFVECGFYDKGGALLSTGVGITFGVSPHAKAFVSVETERAPSASSAHCRARGAH